MTKELFKAEREALHHARTVLARLGIESDPLYPEYMFLTDSFERLLMIGDRLSRISDRTTDSLFHDNKKLRLSQAELTELNEILKERDKERQKVLVLEQAKLAKLVDLGVGLSAEKDTARLTELILLGAKELTKADGGTLYLRNDEDALAFEIMHTDSLGIAMGGTTGQRIDLPPVPLYGPDGEENHHNVVSHAVLTTNTVNIEDAYEDQQFDFSGTRAFDAKTGYRSQSFLTVPLMPRGGGVIGALQLLNARSETGEVIPFLPEVTKFVEALAAQAAVALDNRNLLEAQGRLLDSFIQLIAGAIDAKSPYTGGHCARVPDLAFRLAQAASEESAGPFADFSLDTEEEWREFRIGAWLHDCGKVTTPEYVVDKATKLETIYNRIHEIRTRFEVLRRDAEIAYLNGRLEGSRPEPEVKAEFDERVAQLEDDFAFVAECNIGGEFMDPERVERLKGIAEETWQRHFDDRLGLAHLEMKAFEGRDPVPLPTREKLLDDKPEHVIPRGPFDDPIGPDNPFNFEMDMPEALYDRGEVYNLSIGRGTLTDQERFKINEHIIQTIIMLERLPFPKTLKRIPEIAGAHHETMIGTGYPRKLTKEQMSVPARIMAIADIFEALTAADRPYKKAKSLSEAVRILGFFKKDRHIDPDLFDLFLTSGIYKEYAEDFLLPEQIDDVDISQYIG